MNTQSTILNHKSPILNPFFLLAFYEFRIPITELRFTHYVFHFLFLSSSFVFLRDLGGEKFSSPLPTSFLHSSPSIRSSLRFHETNTILSKWF